MFVYLSKRIAIPNGTTITSIRWNEGEGWLACGGTGGLLKVFKVDGAQQKVGGLSLNQTLELHESTVNIIAWNEQNRRLTTGDEKGQIVVWSLHKGTWFEGMVNNRQKSVVKDLCWCVSGKKICITYADGVVTVGGVDGSRLWSKNLPHQLERCCWSADDQYVLFATRKGDVIVHDGSDGSFISKITIQCLEESDYVEDNEEDEGGEHAEGDGSEEQGGSGGNAGEGKNTAAGGAKARAGGAGKDGDGSGDPEAEGGAGSPRKTSSSSTTLRRGRRAPRVVSLEWCPMWVDRPEPLPMLAIAYENGKIQLMRGVSDDHPVVFDANIPNVQKVAWSPQGLCLAVCGVIQNAGKAEVDSVIGRRGDGTSDGAIPGGSETESNAGQGPTVAAPISNVGVNFFNIEGKLQRTLRVPGKHCGGVTWEGDGLRIALAVDGSVYFAIIRPQYHYGLLQSTAVYAFNRPDKVENSVCFWNTSTGDRKIRHLHRLRHIGTSKDVCLVVSQPDDEASLLSGGHTGGGAGTTTHFTTAPRQVMASASHRLPGGGMGENEGNGSLTGPMGGSTTTTPSSVPAPVRALRRAGKEGAAMVQLLNAICCPMSTRFVDLDPVACELNSSCVVVCGEENVYLWQFRDPSVKVDAVDPVSMQISTGVDSAEERIFHVDELVRPAVAATMTTRNALTNDHICACALSETYLVIARESGLLHLYQIRPLQVIGKLLLPSSRPESMRINCDSTMLAVIDMAGVLLLFPLERDTWSLVPRKAVPLPGFEHKDVWCMRWAEDDPKLFAFMEKSRLYVFHGLVGEEPVQSTCNLFQVKGLEVKGIQFDEVMYDPEKPRKESLTVYKTSTLREIKELLEEGKIQEAYRKALETPHERLWELLAEESLGHLDFPHAEMAIIANKDYPSLQFLKRVKALDNPRKQVAEIESFYRHFEVSEKMYRILDRKDLALEMRQRLGDWFGVVRLAQEGGGDESRMVLAWENIGDNYAEGVKWNKAAQYYAQCRNFRKLAHAYYVMENFEMLIQVIKMVEHDRELLLELGEMLLTVGLAEEAAQAFLSAGEPRRAVDGCVAVNLWERAIALAEEHHLEDVPQLLQKYARYLISRERLPEAIELYQQAGEHDEAAKILLQLGSRAAKTDPLRAKKFYVLAALEVEKFRHRQLALNRGGGEVVEAMLRADYKPTSPDRLLDSAWRGAEAYHFFLLCQQHLQQKHFDTAVILAVRLMEYDDMISLVDSYCLIAIAAYLGGNYGLCSKAFTRLEAGERMDAIGNAMQSGGLLQLMDFTTDLDVTAKGGLTSGGGLGGISAGGSLDGSMMMMTAAAGMGGGGGGGIGGGVGTGSVLSGMTVQLTPRSGEGADLSEANALSYPTVSLQENPARFGDLAVKIFTKHPPVIQTVDAVTCGSCHTYNKDWGSCCVKCGEKFGVCIASGRCIPSLEDAWECAVCRHRAIEGEIDKYSNCPLCHTPIKHRLRRALSDY